MLSITAIVHIYNEEYLLPFWIEHHMRIFSHVVFIDYHSTDQSLEIIRRMAPAWEIRTTRTPQWDAKSDDDEVMDIERSISGFKIALNITDFFLPGSSIEDLFGGGDVQRLHVFTVCSSNETDNEPSSIRELLRGVERAQPELRGHRYLHSREDGNYTLGRHDTRHPATWSKASIVWLGFYPWTERTIQRKLQIRQKLSQCDINIGAGLQHLWSKAEMEERHHKYCKEMPTLDAYPALQRDIQSFIDTYVS
jgi:hypothetical protein